MGTYDYEHDARIEGLVAKRPGAEPTTDALMSHVVYGSTNTAYISLTRSFGVARTYALCDRDRRREYMPKRGCVYVIRLDKKCGVELFDPVRQTARVLGSPFDDPSYHHDGGQDFLLGVSDPVWHGDARGRAVDQPPPGGATPRSANLHRHFEVIVRSLRDSELLAVTAIPGKYITERIEVN